MATELANLVDQLDRQLLVVLRDGRTIVGTLRTFDQFANIVLEDPHERVFADGKYAELPMGCTFIARGENVALIGELDKKREHQSPLRRGDPSKMEKADEERRAEERRKELLLRKSFQRRGVMTSDDFDE
eukprot:CAMPEP_0177628230 /NCGR_PEP_ID=MMETSP0447-20121125/20_1 /TAXON_ID=0 /ORGANISM="Stygamoeba regulata, Strain BSH-02190019" /LENGTH=129 /DNA_ID=CAMNT_0019129463 /DNA_START=107 /DNA_END=496 /DNA_ORIENTATION=-